MQFLLFSSTKEPTVVVETTTRTTTAGVAATTATTTATAGTTATATIVGAAAAAIVGAAATTRATSTSARATAVAGWKVEQVGMAEMDQLSGLIDNSVLYAQEGHKSQLVYIGHVQWIKLDWALITALTKRWRSETQTFHLRHGEMSITLHDVTILMRLPIDDDAVVGNTSLDWTDVCVTLLGDVPKLMRRDSVKIYWLRERFAVIAENASVEMYIDSVLSQVQRTDSSTLDAGPSEPCAGFSQQSVGTANKSRWISSLISSHSLLPEAVLENRSMKEKEEPSCERRSRGVKRTCSRWTAAEENEREGENIGNGTGRFVFQCGTPMVCKGLRTDNAPTDATYPTAAASRWFPSTAWR
ncbi:hypothetical protein Taro_041275 [Colocasia esculenta]|uniref:Aminotransferase-like plant mobile domain-containing protein n=1 Tax=Colocasia esculenta TaxID=4460 RepID=A0A843X071_COLES|nr:hypothetical protein [Colocasia esculenta]